MAANLVCPSCFSANVSIGGKGYSPGKGIAGAAVAGPAGLIVGLHGSQSVVAHCLKCGRNWDPVKYAKDEPNRVAQALAGEKKRFYVSYEKGEFTNAAYYTPFNMQSVLRTQGIEKVYEQLKAEDRFISKIKVGAFVFFLLLLLTAIWVFA